MTDKFITGLYVKPPHEKAPDYVKCKISLKRAEVAAYLASQSEEWINLDVKVSKDGKWYAEINTWKPQGKDEDVKKPEQKPQANHVTDDFVEDDIPFVFSGISILGMLLSEHGIENLLQVPSGIIY